MTESKTPLVTIFTIPKPFRGNIGIIQRNAIKSWLRFRPHAEVILLGDDEGTEAIAHELGIPHVSEVARNEFGTPLLDSLFEAAEQASGAPLMAYVNADIILMADFLHAIQMISEKRFLMVGRRTDLDVPDPLEFDDPFWESQLRTRLSESGRLHGPDGIDYFVFTKGLFRRIPPFAIGRTAWDNWLIFRALSVGAPVIDATRMVRIVHQNHDYSHDAKGKSGIWLGPEVQRNLELAGGKEHLCTLSEASRALTESGLQRCELTLERLWKKISKLHVWHPWTRPFQRVALLLLQPARLALHAYRSRTTSSH